MRRYMSVKRLGALVLAAVLNCVSCICLRGSGFV